MYQNHHLQFHQKLLSLPAETMLNFHLRDIKYIQHHHYHHLVFQQLHNYLKQKQNSLNNHLEQGHLHIFLFFVPKNHFDEK